MAYDGMRTIFIRPGVNDQADEFDYGSSDVNLYPGMCVDLATSAKYFSGNAANKGGYYRPQVVDFNYLEGGTNTDEWAVNKKVPTRNCKPGDLVAVRVGAGTTTNYAKGTYLVNDASTTQAGCPGLSFNSGTLVADTVSHFIVEKAPSADIATAGLVLARCIDPVSLS